MTHSSFEKLYAELKWVRFLLIGISYLSRAQESSAKVRIGNPIPSNHVMKSSSTPTVADAVFIERIKSRVKHWKNACKDSTTRTDGIHWYLTI